MARNVKVWRKYSASIVNQTTEDQDAAILFYEFIKSNALSNLRRDPGIDDQLETFLTLKYVPETEIKFY